MPKKNLRWSRVSSILSLRNWLSTETLVIPPSFLVQFTPGFPKSGTPWICIQGGLSELLVAVGLDERPGLDAAAGLDTAAGFKVASGLNVPTWANMARLNAVAAAWPDVAGLDVGFGLVTNLAVGTAVESAAGSVVRSAVGTDTVAGLDKSSKIWAL
jgi:hypothetical protein